MKKHHTKRFLSVIMAGCMLIAAFALTAFAAEPVAQIGTTPYTSLQAALQAAVQTPGGDVTVELLADVDGTGWTPIKFDSYSASNANSITLKGNGHTITGLDDMLFSSIWTGNKLEIRDLTVSAAKIQHNSTNTGTAVFIGYIDSISSVYLDNCHVVNSTVQGGDWTGAFVGYAAGYSNQNDGPVFTEVTVHNCSVIGSTITGGGSTGAVVGHATGSEWTLFKIDACLIMNNTVTCTEKRSADSADKVGKIVGTIGAAGQKVYGRTGGVFVNVTESGNTAIQAELGGTERTITRVYGRQGSGGVLTITGGAYEHAPIDPEDAFAVLAENANITVGLTGGSALIPLLDYLPFTDVEAGDELYDAVKYVYGAGLMMGTAPDAFSGNKTLTRAMIWTILARANNISTETWLNQPWYHTAQKWAMEQGVTDGTSPERAVTKLELVTMLWRNAGKPMAALDTDVSGIPAWGVEAWRWAVEKGLISGAAGAPATRGETALALYLM